MTANEALAAANEASKTHGRALRGANDFLRELLADGPVLADEGAEKAEGAGIKSRTLDRARMRLGVIAKKEDAFQGRWTWRLP